MADFYDCDLTKHCFSRNRWHILNPTPPLTIRCSQRNVSFTLAHISSPFWGNHGSPEHHFFMRYWLSSSDHYNVLVNGLFSSTSQRINISANEETPNSVFIFLLSWRLVCCDILIPQKPKRCTRLNHLTDSSHHSFSQFRVVLLHAKLVLCNKLGGVIVRAINSPNSEC